MPSILTGRLPEAGQLPTVAEHPRNLFSLFGSQYRTVRYESVTDLCPRWVCASMRCKVRLAADPTEWHCRHASLLAGPSACAAS